MPMPTTRRGRYLFYRSRARRRRDRAWGRGPVLSNATRRKAGRRFDLSLFRKQVVQDTPLLRVAPPRGEPFWEVAGRTKPGRGVWGVVPWPWWFGPLDPTAFHYREPWVGYHHRRLLSLPRLRHLPKLPYPFEIDDLLWWEFYPWSIYPSGRPNPRGWK
jgi:hypothetical protein